MSNEIKKKIEELRQEIELHNRLYYQKDAPIISDQQYDKLLRELMMLEDGHPEYKTLFSPTMKVGAPPVKEFKPFAHTTPMLSISNAFSFEEVRDFNRRALNILRDNDSEIEDVEYICELKIDGLSVALIYEDGILTGAGTRGDGTLGENITANVMAIDSIPKTVKTKGVFEVRGEAFLLYDTFDKINAERKKDGLPLFANPRNAASGSLRQLDPNVTKKRGLSFFAYGIGSNSGNNDPETQSAALELINENHIPINKNFKVCKTLSEVEEFLCKWETLRHSLNYGIDGVVIKVNSFALQRELGSVARSPRFFTAYKFAPEEAETVIKDIKVNVGRTGAITPIAEMEPVIISASKVSRATLHNMDEIERKDIQIGDRVVVHKAGEIIPEIVRSLPEFRNGTESKFKMPEKCPSCCEKIFKFDGEVAYYCINPFCKAQLMEKIVHFASRDAMGIDGLGPKIIEQIMNETKLLHDPSDLYKLTVNDIIKLERKAERSSNNLIDSIQASKTPSLKKFIYALGIRYVGREGAELIADYAGNLANLQMMTEEDLKKIDGVGDVVAKTVAEYFALKETKNLLKKFSDVKVVPEFGEATQKGDKFSGMTFVFTGVLDGITRKEGEEMIKTEGGKSSSSVSKKTDYIVAGKDAGSKLDKAQELGVKIINETQFLAMLKD